jgi:O-antigen ligase
MTSLAYAALWLFVFSIPWESLTAIGGITFITRITGGLALGIAILSALVSGRVRRWRLFHVAALLFVVWCGSGVLIHGMGQVPRKFLTFVQLFAVVWMIWELAPSKKRVLGLMTAYIFGAYVSAFNTILLYRRESGALRRFAAGDSDPNTLAMILAMAIPMAWYLGMNSERPLFRWVGRAFLPAGVLAIGLTGSRGGMLAGLVGLMIVPLTMTRLSPGKLATAMVLLFISGGLAATYVPDTIVQRLATTGSEVEDASLGGRFKLWVAGVNAFAQQPILGYGTSGFIRAVKPALGSRAQVAHNSYLSVMVEEGLIGFLLYATMLFSVFRALLELPPLERRFTLVLLATVMTAMMPLTFEDHKSVWFVLAALMGFAQAYQDARVGRMLPQTSPRPAARFVPRPVPAVPGQRFVGRFPHLRRDSKA